MISRALILALFVLVSSAAFAANYNCTETFGAGEPDFEFTVSSTAKSLHLKAEDVWLDVTLEKDNLSFIKEEWNGRTLEKLVFSDSQGLEWKVSKSLVSGGRSGTVSYSGFDAGYFFRAFKCSAK